jgi:hypothetical protein
MPETNNTPPVDVVETENLDGHHWLASIGGEAIERHTVRLFEWFSLSHERQGQYAELIRPHIRAAALQEYERRQARGRTVEIP